MRKRLLAIIATAAMLVAMIPSMAFASGEIVLPSQMNGAWDRNDETTVYYNGNYYNTLVDALKGVYTSSPTGTAEVYCKPGANVGTMTHGHVADSITIYGNGATVSGGEKDMEIDQYKFNRATGAQDNTSGNYLEKDITVKVYSLNGIAAWGTRNTTHTVNLYFENCKNMQRVYINGTTGANNIELVDCSFDSANGSNLGTSIYSNAAGKITIKNTTFKGIAAAINLNHQSTGTQSVTVEDCTFTNCATPEAIEAYKTKTGGDATTYAAPIRIVAQSGATNNLTVNNATFSYTSEDSANGDILLGDGRASGTTNPGTITVETTGTAAEIQQQSAGYYNATGDALDTRKVATTSVKATEKATVDVDGVITVTANTTPSGTTTTPEASPNTGDNSMAPFAVAGLVLAAMAAVVATRRSYN